MTAEVNNNNFAQEVEACQQTVLIDFWAPWCGPCRMQGPVLEAFAKEHQELKVLKCNVDENPELASKFGIMSIPSLLVFKNGKLVNSAVGLHGQEELAELVQ